MADKKKAKKVAAKQKSVNKVAHKKSSGYEIENPLIIAAVVLAVVQLVWMLLAAFGIYKASNSLVEEFFGLFLPGSLFFIFGLMILTSAKGKKLSKKMNFFAGFSIAFSLLLIIPSLFTLFTIIRVVSTPTKVYTDAALGITLKYPTDWNLKTGGNDPKNKLVFTKGPVTNFRVYGPFDAGNRSLAEEVKAEQHYMSADTFSDESDVMINGLLYHKETIFEEGNEGLMKAQEIMTIKDGKVYFFRYAASAHDFDKDLPEADIFFNSISVN